MKVRTNNLLQVAVALVVSATCGIAQSSGYYTGQNPPPPGTAQQGPMQPGTGSPGSVRPGSLNYIEGQVSSGNRPLTLRSVGHFALESGQALETGSNSYAEILLTPGAFLRVGPNSAFRMTAVGLADTRINLTSGNAMIEADQVIAGTHLELTLGSTSVDLIKKGLYEFTANPPDVKAFEGKADVIGLNKSREIGKHDQVLLDDNGRLKKTSFDENQAKNDPLYVWSEARSRDEAAQNKLVAQNPYGYAPVGGGWFWDPYANYYGFWPSAFLYSPFGFGFYGGFYPGFYGGYAGGYHPHGIFGGGHFVGGGVRGFSGVHGNGVAGGFHGGGGGGRR